MDTEHTPLPWTHSDGCMYDAKDHLIGISVGFDDGDAALIVRSVNLRPELIEALELSRTTLREAPFLTDAMLRTLATIDALIAKATS